MVRELAPDLLTIAQGIAPKDTLNLMMSIYYQYTINGLKYIYDGGRAPYTQFQQEGFTHWKSGKFIDKNKGFIDNTVAAFNSYIVGQMANLRNGVNANKKGLIGYSSGIDTPARQQTLLRSVSQRVRRD